MRFVAKKIDLDLELTTLSSEKVKVPGPIVSGTQAGKLAERFTEEDQEFDRLPDEERTAVTIGRHFAAQLAGVYAPGSGEEGLVDPDPWSDPGWWMDNFDVVTIKEIRGFVVATLLGVKKKGN
jgi:hypothetical protein